MQIHLACQIILFILSTPFVLSVPLPQGAGVGEACDDTGSGLAVKEAGQNAASLLKSAGIRRQGAGVGEACDAILTDADTGSGLAVKEGLTNAASLIKSAGVKREQAWWKRQLDKVGAGTAAVISIVDPDLASFQEGLTNNIDGDGTSDSAFIGEQVGALEAEVGVGTGNLVPSKLPKRVLGKRQLEKAGAGTAAVLDVIDPELGAFQEGLTNNIDSDGTSDSAVIGDQVGALEAEVGEGVGNLVPSKLPTGL